MRVNICRMAPAGYLHVAALDEVIESYLAAFQMLGIHAERVDNAFVRGCLNLIFGAHLLTDAQLALIPNDCIICNFEQVDAHSPWLGRAGVLSLLSRCEVWDYCQRNADLLQQKSGNTRIRVVPVGYVPALSRIQPASVQDIDVLFYGSMNERRKAILDALKASGLNVVSVFGAYGPQRDALIARSKVVLNLHYYDVGVFEVVRVSYLLANAVAVVSEVHDIDDVPQPLRSALWMTGKDLITDACQCLVRQPDARQRLQNAAIAGIRRIRMEQGVFDVLSRHHAPLCEGL